MPHTMADELALMEDPKRAAVTKGILTAGQVLDKLPVENVTSLETEGFRWKSLPSVSFNLPNENYTEGTGKIESVAWGVVRIGHDIDIDRIYDKTAHFVKPKTLYTEQTLEAINFTINDSLINGDKATNPRGFDGFKKISAGLPARQVIDAGLAKYGGTGTVLDISAGGASSAVRQGFFDALLRAKRVTEGSQPDLAIMNENVLDLFDSMLRREGLYKVNEDQFEREVTSWKKISFVDAGYKDPDGNALILGDDHDVPGNTALGTSIYFLKLDAKRHVGLIQLQPIDTREMGELQSGPKLRTRVDWVLGPVVWGKRSMTRLRGIKVA